MIVEDATVVGIEAIDELPEPMEVENLGEGVLAPGFIDLQVNGGGGALFTADPSPDALKVIASAHRASGTTSLMPTVLSSPRATQEAALEAVNEARAQGDLSILGLHLEGPFFEHSRRGAHRAEMIRALQGDDIDWLLKTEQRPLMLTLAPEHCPAGVIEQLTQAGIMVCAGHTDASAEQIQASLKEGLRGFTHLFNAMSQLTARAPGTVGAALDDQQSWIGLIADGHHVHPINLSLAHRAKADGKVCLVTDAMGTVGSVEKSSRLYDETITEQEGRLINAEGKLAGSAIGMIEAVAYAHHSAGIELGECLNMASRYPAEFLGRQSDLGLLTPGYRADMVHFDDEFRVRNTWVAGNRLTH